MTIDLVSLLLCTLTVIFKTDNLQIHRLKMTGAILPWIFVPGGEKVRFEFSCIKQTARVFTADWFYQSDETLSYLLSLSRNTESITCEILCHLISAVVL